MLIDMVQMIGIVLSEMDWRPVNVSGANLADAEYRHSGTARVGLVWGVWLVSHKQVSAIRAECHSMRSRHGFRARARATR